MKKIVFTFTLLLTLNCNAQKKDIMENLMKMPEFNEKYEFFDKKTFFLQKEQNNQRSEYKKKIIGNDTFHCHKYNAQYEEIDQKGRLRMHFFGTAGYDYSTNPIIGVYKEFYENGGIKMKGILCCFGFKMGLWYRYDLDGKLIEVENYDEGFDFTAKDIFSYCLNNNISLEKGNEIGGMRTRITRYRDVENRTFWVISYPDNTKGTKVSIQIDGKTGEVISISEKEVHYIE